MIISIIFSNNPSIIINIFWLNLTFWVNYPFKHVKALKLINIHEANVVPSYVRSESTAHRAEKHKHDTVSWTNQGFVVSIPALPTKYVSRWLTCVVSDVWWLWMFREVLMLMPKSRRQCCGVWTPCSPHIADSTLLTYYRWESPDKYPVTYLYLHRNNNNNNNNKVLINNIKTFFF